jgi:hypothetical protein
MRSWCPTTNPINGDQWTIYSIFSQVLGILFGLINSWFIRFVAILQVNSNWVPDACCDKRPKVHRFEGTRCYLLSLCRASFLTNICLRKCWEVPGEFDAFNIGLVAQQESTFLSDVSRVWKALELATSCYFTTTALNRDIIEQSVDTWCICDSRWYLNLALSSLEWSQVAAVRTPLGLNCEWELA